MSMNLFEVFVFTFFLYYITAMIIKESVKNEEKY